MGLCNFFDWIELNFEKGGKWEKYFFIYEMVESFFYMLKMVMIVVLYVCFYIDMKWIMIYVVMVMIFCILMVFYNIGY